MRAGVIVAGGRSTRFGEADKAVADLAGVPMIRRVADGLAGAVDALVANCRSDQTPAVREALDGVAVPVEFAEDERSDLGPAAGIRTGLRAVDAEFGTDAGRGIHAECGSNDIAYAAVVACDVPFVDPDFVEYLFERARGTGESRPRDAAIPRIDGRRQPLVAVYRIAATIEACDATLSRGERSVTAALSELDLAVVGEDEWRARTDPRTFENLNAREEFEAAAEYLRSSAGE